MKPSPISRLLLSLLLAAGPCLGQAAEVRLLGQIRSPAEVGRLIQDLERDLAAFEQAPPSDPAEREAERASFSLARDAMLRLAEVLDRTRLSRDQRQEIERQIRTDREALTEALVLAQRPPRFETMSEEGLKKVEAVRLAAAQAIAPAEANLAAADLRVRNRATQFESIGDEIARTQTALETATQEMQSGGGVVAVQRRRERAALGREAAVRMWEISRDHHASLLAFDQLGVESARVRLDLARAKAARAEVEFAAARSAREATLAEEAALARQQAQAAAAQAQQENSKSERAITSLSAFVSKASADQKDEEALRSRAQGVLASITAIRKQVQDRNAAITSVFPEGAQLDEWKIGALAEHRRGLELSRRRYERGAEREVAEIPELLRNTLFRRDRLHALHATVSVRDDHGRDLSAELDDLGADADQQEWLRLQAELAAGIIESPPEMEQDFRLRFEQRRRELLDVLDARIKTLIETEEAAQAVLEVSKDVDLAFEERSRYLDRISFWLKGALPLSGQELVAAGSELRTVGANFAGVPASSRDLFQRIVTRFSSNIFGPWPLLLVPVVGLLLHRFLRLRARRMLADAAPERHDSLKRARIMIAGFLSGSGFFLVILIALLAYTFLIDPEDVAGRVAWSFSAMVFGITAFHGLVEALLWLIRETKEPPPPPTPQKSENRGLTQRMTIMVAEAKPTAHSFRFFRRGLTLLSILVPASVAADALGHYRLGTLLRLVVAAMGLLWAVRVYFRPDLISGFLPVGSSALAAGIRVGIIRLWPLAVLFYLALMGLRLAGYETASWYYASRSLLCGAALLASMIMHRLLQGYLNTQLGPPAVTEEDQEALEDADLSAMRRSFFRRTLGALTQLTVVVLTILLVGAIFGVSLRDWGHLSQTTIWNRGGRTPLTLGDLFASLAVFVFALFLARLIRDGLQVMLRDRMQRGSRYAIRTVAFYMIAGIGSILALSTLGLDLDQLGWFLTAAGVGIGFGLQEIISNFICGLILFFERPVQVGDVITLGSIQGDVTRINIRSTVVRTRDGISIIIPNKRLITDDVVNLSHGDPKTRLRLPVSVAYGSDLSTVKRILLDVAEREGRVLTKPRAEVNFKEFGDSALNFELLMWLPRPDITLRRRVTSDLNSAIDAAFRRAGIVIPFPQRDLHVKSWDGPEPKSEESPERSSPPRSPANDAPDTPKKRPE